MSSIDKTLDERGTRYGEFAVHAEITQHLKDVMQGSPKWNALESDQREALEMTAHKIGRILNGDPNYIDSWHDIIGYIRLVEQRLEKQQAATKQSSFAFDSNQAATFGATPEGDRGPAPKEQSRPDPLAQLLRAAKEAAGEQTGVPAEELCECPGCTFERTLKAHFKELGLDVDVEFVNMNLGRPAPKR